MKLTISPITHESYCDIMFGYWIDYLSSTPIIWERSDNVQKFTLTNTKFHLTNESTQKL